MEKERMGKWRKRKEENYNLTKLQNQLILQKVYSTGYTGRETKTNGS